MSKRARFQKGDIISWPGGRMRIDPATGERTVPSIDPATGERTRVRGTVVSDDGGGQLEVSLGVMGGYALLTAEQIAETRLETAAADT